VFTSGLVWAISTFFKGLSSHEASKTKESAKTRLLYILVYIFSVVWGGKSSKISYLRENPHVIGGNFVLLHPIFAPIFDG
jgi:hypothetical protein